MTGPARRRRGWTWAWLACVVGLSAVYAASARYALTLSLSQTVAIGIVAGAVECHIRDARPASPPPTPANPRVLPPGFMMAGLPKVEHEPVYFFRHHFTFAWVPRLRDSIVTVDQWVEIPLWMPLAPLVAVGAWLWMRRWARIRRGHCRDCGYDLHSCVGPVCPECGAAMKRAGAAPAPQD